MTRSPRLAILLPALLWPAAVGGQAPPGTSPTASPSFSNPAISVIGWFQGAGGADGGAQEKPFELREAEVAYQAAVDPHSRADFFLAASGEGLELEEGYLTWLALPGGAQLKVGKFRADLGKLNRTHPPETPFADIPLAMGAFLGEEGLALTGASLSALLPNPAGLYWDVVAHAAAPPDSEESPVFHPDRRSDLLAAGRSSLFVPLSESADLNLGVSYANALARPGLRGEGSRAQLGSADLTFRWKNPRRSIYRSLWVQAEGIAGRGSGEDASTRAGFFGFAIWQFARQWKAGLRYDWTEAPGTDDHASGALALLAWQPSEFSTLSVQARRLYQGGEERDAAFFKWIFNIGPHGAHPY